MRDDEERAVPPAAEPPDYAVEIRIRLPTARTAREAERHLSTIVERLESPVWELIQAEVYTY